VRKGRGDGEVGAGIVGWLQWKRRARGGGVVAVKGPFKFVMCRTGGTTSKKQ
jgi:hypothetical protein